MIVDSILQMFSTFATNVASALPDASTISSGNGGTTTCCAATMLINGIDTSVAGVPFTVFSGGAVAGASGGVLSFIDNTPIPLIVDFAWLGFVVGVILAIAIAFFITDLVIKIAQIAAKVA